MDTILVVDRDRPRVARLRQQLERFDLAVNHVATAFEALTLIEREHPHVVLSRWDAGEMTAAELVATLHSDGAVAPFKAVLVLDREHQQAAAEFWSRFDLVVDGDETQAVAAAVHRLLGGRSVPTIGGQSSISGIFDMFDLADLIQTMSSGRKSGVLALACGGHAGSVTFEEGRVRHARYRGEEGRRGFARLLLELRECGRAPFTFEAMRPEQIAAVPETIGASAPELLFEIAVAQDERRHRSEVHAPAEAPIPRGPE